MSSSKEFECNIVSIQDTMDQLSAKVDRYHLALVNIVDKKNNKKKEIDESERGNWSSKLDFLLSCLGYAVGLGNVWRFPFLAYDNGGGAFFIPYCIMLLLVGIPIFFMELNIGQFTSSGPATCWKMAPLFYGVGAGMVIVSALVAIYYNMIIAWAFYYLFASFTSDLPWAKCRTEWATSQCRDYLLSMPINDCKRNNWTVEEDGACYNIFANPKIITAVYNETLAAENDIYRRLPSEEYLRNEVLGIGRPGAGLEDMGPIHWQLMLCYLLAWILVCVTLSKGVKSSGKVVYFTATFPFLVLIILLVRGVLLEGHYSGISFYISPNFSILKEAKVWKAAAVQIFFSISASFGGLIALSSYNKFSNDTFRDTIIVSFGNCATSVFAGFVIFSYLGFLSNDLNISIENVAKTGTTLAFVVYPFAVAKMPIATFWSIIFFIMIITLGVDSEFVLVETVTTSFMDVFPKTRKFKSFVVMVTCLVFFLLGLTLTTDGGLDMLNLMDTYSGGWNVLIIALCECVCIGWVYGYKRFLMDIETMIGIKVCGCLPWIIFKYFWAVCWCLVTPVLLLMVCVQFVLVFSWIDYQRVDGLPYWSDALGWGMTLSVVLAIFAGAIFKFIQYGGRIDMLIKPTPDWGPASNQDRSLIANYVANFIVDAEAARLSAQHQKNNPTSARVVYQLSVQNNNYNEDDNNNSISLPVFMEEGSIHM